MNRKGTNWNHLSVFFISFCFLILASWSSACAQNDTRPFFDALQRRLIADGFDAEHIARIYQNENVLFETRGVLMYFQHNEATLNYKKILTTGNIRNARYYMQSNARTLDEAQKIFGVNPQVIIAIILVETRFGRFLGRKSILNTLSTMAALNDPEPREFLWKQLPEEKRFERSQYDRKADQKKDWAYNELKAFLSYTALYNVDPTAIDGSYAGALGIAQFMPSSILGFGQDGNGDGRVDLFNDADAIFSIANYLYSYGWKEGLDRDQSSRIIYEYNHSKYYVDTVLNIAELLKE